MKIVVFGASGGTGLKVVGQALNAGHSVTAFIRTPSKLMIQHSNLILFQSDVMDAAAVERVIAGQDVVISTLGPTRPFIPGMMKAAAQNILAGMHKQGVRRIISTTGAGVRDPQDKPQLIDHLMKGLLTLLARNVLVDSAANAELIRSSDLEWTIARFPRLVDGKHTGNYRVGYLGKDSGSQISRDDGADFILKELIEKKWIRKMPVISY